MCVPTVPLLSYRKFVALHHTEILLYQYPHEKLPSLNDEAVTTFSVPNLRTAFDTLQEQGLETEPFNLDPRDIDFLFEHPDGYVFRIKELEPDLDANLQ